MTRLTEAEYQRLLRSNPDIKPQQAAQKPVQRTQDAQTAQTRTEPLYASLRLLLPSERPLSRNVTQRMHWTQRRRVYALISRRTLVQAQAVASATQTPLPFAEHVTITFTVYFKSRPFDVDNVDVKPYIDALKGVLIADDSPKHVHSYVIVAVDKTNPRVEITLTPTRKRSA